MTVAVPQFRSDYPEFQDTEAYPDSAVNYWLAFAYNFLNTRRWGQSIDLGAELMTAHNLTLEARAQAEALNGMPPGGQVGPLNSKSVDKVSAGYDTAAGTQEGGGHWNLTIYGTRFLRLARMFGAGPVQIGIGITPPLTGDAWPGPDCEPGFTTFG